MKSLYQRRTDGNYKGYTKDSFYFNSTEQLWCWKQSSKNMFQICLVEIGVEQCV